MILRQLFDYDTYTFTYLIGDKASGKAAIIDPVLNRVDQYLGLLSQLELTLVYAFDTHVHADHITALGTLREKTGCRTFLGIEGEVQCSDEYLTDNLNLEMGSINIKAIYTPGHTNDSFCFLVNCQHQNYLFSGDTLFIRGTGRTDFQNGSAEQLYDSLHDCILTLDDDTIVYPGHDYNGNTQSSIREERLYNPRLQILHKPDFIEYMNNLDLPDPKYMDIAVPANLACGKKPPQ